MKNSEMRPRATHHPYRTSVKTIVGILALLWVTTQAHSFYGVDWRTEFRGMNRLPSRLPRELVGFADGAGQAANGRRGIAEWIAFLLPALQLRLGTLFGLFDSRYQIVAVRRFRPVSVVFRT